MRIWAVVLGLWLTASVLLAQQAIWRQPIVTGEAVAYAPNGSLIATIATGNQVVLYQSGQAVGVLRGALNPLTAIVFAPSGQFLAACDDAGEVYLWRLSDGALLWRVSAFAGRALCLRFVNDALLAVGGDGGVLQLRRASDGGLERTLTGHVGAVSALAIAPDGSELVSGDENGQARLWRINDGELRQTWQAQAGAITAIAWSSNQTLAIGSLLGRIRLWARNAQGQWFQTVQIIAHDGAVSGLAFAGTTMLYSAGSLDGKVRRWNPTNGASQGEFTASDFGVLSLALRPDGTQIATGVGERAVRLWNINGAAQGTLGGHQDSVIAVGFAQSNLLATVSYDETLRLWSLTNGAPYGTPVNLNGFVLAGAVHPNGGQIALGYFDGKVALRTLPAGVLARVVDAHTEEVLSLAYSPDGGQLVSGSYDGTAKVWNVSTGTLVHTLSGHFGGVHAVVVSSDRIATGDTNGEVRLWNRATGLQERVWSAHNDPIQALAFSPDGALLATGGQDNMVRVWRVSDGVELRAFTGHEFGATQLLFISNNWLLTADGAGFVRLYAIDTGELSGQWQLSGARIESMAYWAQQQRLAIGGDEGVTVFQFTGAPNRPPSIPELLAPADGASFANRTPTFRVRAADPDNQAVRVEIEIEYAGQRRLLQSGLAPSGSEFALNVPSSAPLAPLSYTWRARAIDEFGGASDWSAPRTLTITNQNPAAPQLLEPDDGATTPAQPTFRARLTDPEGDRCRLIVRISGDGGFERTLESGLVNSDSEAQVSATQALASGVYTWQAKTRDEYGAESDWSAARSFIVPANRAPNTPELLEPAPNATVSPTPTFRARLTDPDNDRVKAIVEIAPANGNPITLETTFVNSGETAQVSISSGQPLQAGAYRWRARARDNRDALSEWSEWRDFQVSSGDNGDGGGNDGNNDGDNPSTNQPPTTPTLVAPNANAVASPTPTFRLQASDPDNDTIHFEIEVNIGNRQFTFTTDAVSSGATAVWRVPVAQALPTGAGSWRARARDARGALSEWTSPRPLTISSGLPSQLQGVQTFSLSLNVPNPTLEQLGLQGVRVVAWDPAAQQYRDVSQLQWGRGYFVRAETPVQPDLSGAPITGETRIALQVGWNLISHPYLNALGWDESAIRVVRSGETRTLREAHQAGWLELYAWTWDAARGRYQLVCDPRTLPNAQAELPPSTGAWILAWQPCELVLNPTTRVAIGRSAPLMRSGQWALRVQAWAGERYDEATVGVGEMLQAIAPPSAPTVNDPIQIRVLRGAQGLSADIRSVSERTEWTLEVVVAPADAPQTIELRLPDVMYLPRRTALTLYDEQTQRAVPLRGRARYAFVAPAEGGVFRFRIQPERTRTPLQILHPTAQGGRSTGGQFTLQATLTAPAQVQFEIRAAGRTVRTLPLQTTRSAGAVQVVWDGRDEAGRALPPGSYQAYIRAQSEDGQTARAVIPILLTR